MSNCQSGARLWVHISGWNFVHGVPSERLKNQQRLCGLTSMFKEKYHEKTVPYEE